MNLLLGAGEWGWGNPWLLLWSVAIAIPLLLHFWKKRPKQEFSWAAMRFLEEAVQEKSKRSQLENWLLLLLRCFAVLLLALAVARPWLQTGQEITLSMERPPKLAVIVLDRSYSMQYRDRDRSLWDIAKKQASEHIKQLKKNDALILYGLSNEVDALVPSASFDHAAVLKELESTSATDCIASIDGIVSPIRESIVRSLQRYPHLREVEVGLYSDFAMNTWGNFSFDSAAEELSHGLIPVQVRPFSSLAQATAFSNVGVRSLKRIGIAKSGVPSSIEVEVERFGGNSVSQSTLELIVDKKTIASQTFQVELHGTTTIRLPWTPDHTGNHSIEVRLGIDDLEVDNSRWLTVDVKRRRKTLILEQNYQASQYLQVALESETKSDAGSEVVVKKLARSEPLALEDVDVVVLADMQLSDPNQLRTIRQFVENGGGLMVWTGNNTRSSLASNLFGSQEGAVSPLVLREIAVNESLGIDPRNYESPVIAAFRDFPNSGLLTTPIYRYWKIDPLKESKIQVDLALTDGQPLLLHHPFGEGLVYWMLTAPTPVTSSNEEWNGLAGWPSFVPIVSEIHKALVGNSQQKKEFIVGQSLQGTHLSHQTMQCEILAPNGVTSSQIFKPDLNLGIVSWSLPSIKHQGIYRLDWGPEPGAIKDENNRKAAPELTQYFAVCVDTAESQQEYLAASNLPSEEESSNPVGVDQGSSKAYRTAELFRWFLIGLMLCLVSETIVSWWLAFRFERTTR